MAPSPADRDVRSTLLALFVVLVALLGVFAAGAYHLVGHMDDGDADLGRPAVIMSVLAATHFCLAWGLWKQRPWVRWFVLLSIAALVGAAVLDASRQQVLDLGAALWLLLAGVANFAVLVWTRLGPHR